MHLKRLINLSMALVILGMFFIVQPVNAEEEDIQNRVNAELNIELISATDLKISVTMDVSRAVAFGSVYDHSGIASLATSSNPDDIEARGVIKRDLHDALKSQIEASFENADVAPVYEKPVYENNVFVEEYMVNLTSSFFDMNETVNAHDFVNGVLDMDANVSYAFDLSAEGGWNNSYIFDLGDNFDFYTDGEYNEIDKTITWEVLNGNGNRPYKTAELILNAKNPTVKNLDSENIFLEFELDSTNVKETSLNANVVIETADISVYNVLPDFIDNLQFIPADGFRLFEENGFITWNNTYEKTVKPVKENITRVIEESSFNQTLDLTRTWDNISTIDCPVAYEVDNMNSEPSLKMILSDGDVDFKICSLSNRALFGLINSGANTNISQGDINFGDKLNEIGYDYNASLFLPDNMYLDGKNIYKWNESVSVKGKFESDVANSFTKEKKETIIEMEVQSTDLNLLSFFTGKTELTFGMYLQEKREYNVTSTSGVFSLPEKVVLPHLCSDAFRLCVEENVFSAKNIDDYLVDEKNLFESRLKNILSGLDVQNKGHVKREVFESSLNDWDQDISEMDADVAIKIDSYAHCSHPISFDLSFLPPGFDVNTQYFNFTGIENHNVTYRVVFPKGISLRASDPLNKVDIKRKSDGRQYIEVKFDESEHNLTTSVTCEIIPSGFFIIGILMPCIISLIITIVLIVTIFIIRKKRKTGRGMVTHGEDDSFTDYEDEDYYVPPPPGSK